MTDLDRLRRPLVLAHAALWLGAADTRAAVARRTAWRDERGDIAARTVGIAIMAALAIAVGGIITTKVTNKANSINLDATP
ncbi:MAG: hypothetical protein AAFN30_00225 [Actinomycetota bacterium]